MKKTSNRGPYKMRDIPRKKIESKFDHYRIKWDEYLVDPIRAAMFSNMMTFGRIYSAMCKGEEIAATCRIENESINIWQGKVSIYLERLSNGNQSEFMEIRGCSLDDARKLVVTWVSRSMGLITNKKQ